MHLMLKGLALDLHNFVCSGGVLSFSLLASGFYFKILHIEDYSGGMTPLKVQLDEKGVAKTTIKIKHVMVHWVSAN